MSLLSVETGILLSLSTNFLFIAAHGRATQAASVLNTPFLSVFTKDYCGEVSAAGDITMLLKYYYHTLKKCISCNRIGLQILCQLNA